MNRRGLIVAAGALPLAAATPVRAAEPGVVVQTVLKAHEGQRERLGRFITQNWLVMDRVAIAAGLFTHATLYDLGADDRDGDFIVEVGYVDARGYAAVAEAFDVIRLAHVTEHVDGLGFGDLGRIVGDRSLIPLGRA